MKKNNKIRKFILLLVILLSGCKPDDTSSLSDTNSRTEPTLTDPATDSVEPTDTIVPTDPITDTTTDPDIVGDHVPMPTKYNSYYSGLSSSPEKNTLKNVVSTHTKLGYSSLANIMTQTDRDWDLSPSKSDTNPYMRLIYAGYNFNKSTAAKRSDYGGDSDDIWDKEHIWAKSHGGFDNDAIPGSDLHHLRASDKPNNNNHRNSRNFGNVTGGSVGKDFNGYNSGKYSGSTSSGIYEPLDHDKGDVARACFYMALVYPNNCKLVNSYPGGGTSLGHLNTLLIWHELDPVDEFEMNRNNLIYDNYQRNRNPFIDHPEWAHLGYF